MLIKLSNIIWEDRRKKYAKKVRGFVNCWIEKLNAQKKYLNGLIIIEEFSINFLIIYMFDIL